MWYEIFKFEINYRIKRPETYIFFIFLLLFSIVGVEFIFNGFDLGSIKMNAPIIIAKSMAAITGLLMIITSLIMGVPILRDFEHNIESLMYVNPIKKADYLLGRFLGSFVVVLFAFSGMLLGFIIGEFTPLKSPEQLMPFRLLSYVQPFVTVVIPTLFFSSALFFVTGALIKKLIVVYTQGVFIFVAFLLTKAITNDFAQGVLDPFSLTTLTDVNEFWSLAERNLNLIPVTGILFYNKLFWFIISLCILAFGYHRFNFNVVNSKSKKKKTVDLERKSPVYDEDIAIPTVSLHQNFKTKLLQLVSLSWFYFKSTCKQTSFWAIVLCGLLIILINSINLQNGYGVDTIPKTYIIVGELQELSLYFFMIVLIFYSGELIWKEREANLNSIYDATSISDSVGLVAKFLSLLGIYTVMIFSLILFGIAFQIANGYYQFELELYLYGFFIEVLPYLILYTIVSFFFHIVVNKKFTGFILLIVFAILNLGSEAFGFEHDLYKFGGNGLASYSDMNGYGHFLKPYIWIKTYWILFGILLLIVSAPLSVRGAETNLRTRFKLVHYRLTKPLFRTGVMTTIVFLIIGSYIFYNTNILNTYKNTFEQGEIYAQYEKTLKKFEYTAQPKITSVHLKVELYPETRNYTIAGHYILKNTQKKVINSIYIQKSLLAQVELTAINFDKITTLNNDYATYGLYIYGLKNALQPGDSIKMNFSQSYINKGFEENNLGESVFNNGTFLTNKILPTIGYNKEFELQDTKFRKNYKLLSRKGLENRNHEVASTYGSAGGDADLINLDIIIGTDLNQKAITSGELQKKWIEAKRSYFHYRTKQPILNNYAIFSARYEVLKDTWNSNSDSSIDPIELEIYYHKGHEYNLNKIVDALKLSFDYYTANFSKYKNDEIRILEVSNYIDNIQSLPNIISFSETNEFILNSNDESNVDMLYYKTAHELAHQWWGMQVEAANTQGRNLIIETLSQYSALMVMKQKYSNEKIMRLLQKEKENYLDGKKRDSNQEVSLKLVENQEYVYYAKGAINMYKFQKIIGEDKVNLALKQFLEDWNTIDGVLKTRTNRYATSKELLAYLREVTPSLQQHIITDLFESVDALKIN
jgi:ABC-2 type transport system permease protein